MKIGIVGAGPAGMAAALEASRYKAEIHLWDANPSPGRKLAATGSGRCNLTNIQVEAGRYHTKHPQQLSKIFNQFGYPQFIAWLEDMGIFVTTTADGWVYPTSFSAQNVVDILQAQLNIRGVKIHPRSLITAITPTNNGFCLKTQDRQKQLSVDRLIIASGGPAAPQLGARENMYAVLKQLGHTVLPVKPALAPLLTDGGQFHKLQGVRLDAAVHLLKEGREIEKTTANIIFTGWGINGPGVMNLSYLVSLQEMQSGQLSIDFLPDTGEKLEKMLNEDKFSQLPISAMLKSFFPDKLVYFLLEKCGISPHKKISETEKR